MGEPALNQYDDEERSQVRYLSARQKATLRWGMDQNDQAGPAAGEPTQGREDSPLSTPKLRALEGGGETTAPTGFAPTLINGGVKAIKSRNPVGRFFLGSARRKQATAGGSVLGIGGVVALVGMLIGVAQPIHLSQILGKDNHSNEQTANLRVNALYRYAKSGNYGENRLTYFGSKRFATTQTELAKIGVSFEQYKTFGNAKAYTVEIDKNPATNGLSREQSKATLTKLFQEQGIKITEADFKNVSGTKLAVFRKDIGTAAFRQVSKSSVTQLGYNKVISFMKFRQVGKFLNLPSITHPLSRAFANGEAKADAKLDANARSKKAAEAEAERARQKAQQASNQEKAGATKEKLSGKLTGVKASAGGALLVTGVICIVRGAADDAVAYNRAAVVTPQVINAVDAQAVGSQEQSGMDFYASQLGAFNDTLSDPDGSTIWQSAALQATMNPSSPVTGKDIPEAYAQAFNSESSANKWANFGGDPGKYACSTVGQVLQLAGGAILVAASFETGGSAGAAAIQAAKTVGGLAGGAIAMKELSNLITSSLADDAVDGKLAAPVRGGLLAYGNRELANINARAGGGVPLSAAESLALDRQESADSSAEFSAKSTIARLFDTSDYRSATSRVIDQQSPNTRRNLQNVASSLIRVPNMLSSVFSSIMPKAQAAGTPYNFGFNRVGIPSRVLNNPDYDDPYANADVVSAMLDRQDGTPQQYIDKAMKCFGSKITKDDKGWGAVPDKEVNPNSGEYEDADCGQANDSMWDRMMLFVQDNGDADAVTCYLGDQTDPDETQACANLGVSPGEEPVTETDAASTEFTVASYNMCQEDNHACTNADNKTNLISNLITSKSIDIIGAQELSASTQKGIMAKLSGYESFPANVPADQGRAVIWNTAKFKKTTTGRLGGVYSNDGNFVKNDTDDKAFPWVQLTASGGQTVYALSVHSPSNTNSGNTSKRVANAKAIADWAKQKSTGGAIVIVTGDFNSSGAKDGSKASGYCILTGDVLQHAFDMESQRDSTKKCPTSDAGNIPIDQIYASANVGLTASNWTRLDNAGPKTGTDHSPAFVTFTLPGSSTASAITGGSAKPYKNPVFNGNVPDPTIIRGDDGTYHIYTTGAGLQHLTSKDLVTWRRAEGKIIDGAPSEATGKTWAPDVQKTGDHYTMTWAGTASSNTNINHFKIYYATGLTAAGPFKYRGLLIPEGYLGTYSLDPNIYMSDQGPILYYGSGGKGITAVKLNIAADGSIKLAGPEQILFAANPVGAPNPEWIAEGAWMQKHGSYYYMYYSVGRFDFTNPSVPDYQVHVARATSPLGPFEKDPTPVLTGNTTALRPGHNSITLDNAGNEWMVYHAYVGSNRSDRQLMIDLVTYQANGWPIVNDGHPSMMQQSAGPVTVQTKGKNAKN